MRLAACLAALQLLSGCVLNSTYGDALKKWTDKNNEVVAELEATQAERDQYKAKSEELDSQLKQTTLQLGDREATLVKKEQTLSEKTSKLQASESEKAQLSEQVSSLSEDQQRLKEEKEKVIKERADLAQEVKDLRRLKSASEARSAEYKSLLGKLSKMIDAGSLEVKVRNGVMVVRMPSDVLFPAGEATLKPEAVEAIKELAKTIKQFKGRKFQVVGHSDSTPISTEEFPSNWELSAKRAIEVTKVMIQAGVPPTMLNAAGSASYDPLVRNSSAKNRAKNRRVELIFVPKIDELPTFEEGK